MQNRLQYLLRSCRGGILVLLGICSVSYPTYAEGLFPIKWKLTTPGAWPVAVIKGKMILKNGNTLSAYRLKSGKQVWRQSFKGLRYGEMVLAAGREYVYVLNSLGIMMIDPQRGTIIKTKTVKNPDKLLFRENSVYVTGGEGIVRFDKTLDSQKGKAIHLSGELLEARGSKAAILTRQGLKNKLFVVDFEQGKKVYEFTLMPYGDHQIVRLEQERIVFIDYSRRDKKGKNKKVLYYTEVDIHKSKKLKDIPLSKAYSEIYPSPTSDFFVVAADPSGILFLGNHGSARDHSSLHAYDPTRNKVLWSRSGEILSTKILMYNGVLWSSLTQKNGSSYFVAYNVDDGNLLTKEKLDSPATGVPVAIASNILVRTRQSIYCFSSKPKSEPEPSAAHQEERARPQKRQQAWPGWRLFRDKVIGYYIQVPKNWVLEQKKVLKFGGIKMSVPFMFSQVVGSRKRYLASVHVLTDKAYGRDTNSLWQSIYNQRRQSNPSVRVVKVYRVRNLGKSDLSGIKAVYEYKTSKGKKVTLKSLCIVNHGVAFEIRAWVSQAADKSIWRIIDKIFTSFFPSSF